jgi:hypothetical protein
MLIISEIIKSKKPLKLRLETELSTFQHLSTKEKKKQKKKISSTSAVNIFQDLTKNKSRSRASRN